MTTPTPRSPITVWIALVASSVFGAILGALTGVADVTGEHTSWGQVFNREVLVPVGCCRLKGVPLDHVLSGSGAFIGAAVFALLGIVWWSWNQNRATITDDTLTGRAWNTLVGLTVTLVLIIITVIAALWVSGTIG